MHTPVGIHLKVEHSTTNCAQATDAYKRNRKMVPWYKKLIRTVATAMMIDGDSDEDTVFVDGVMNSFTIVTLSDL
jgi:hypothetical protein